MWYIRGPAFLGPILGTQLLCEQVFPCALQERADKEVDPAWHYCADTHVLPHAQTAIFHFSAAMHKKIVQIK